MTKRRFTSLYYVKIRGVNMTYEKEIKLKGAILTQGKLLKLMKILEEFIPDVSISIDYKDNTKNSAISVKEFENMSFQNKHVKSIEVSGGAANASVWLSQFILSENYDQEISETLIKIDKSVFGLKKIINKEKYEPVYDFINKSKITFDEKLIYFSKYQTLSGTITKIKTKEIDNNKLLKIIKSLKEKNIKYACIEIENDN